MYQPAGQGGIGLGTFGTQPSQAAIRVVVEGGRKQIPHTSHCVTYIEGRGKAG